MLAKTSFLLLVLEFGFTLPKFCGFMEHGEGSMDFPSGYYDGDVIRPTYTRGQLYAIRRTMNPPDDVHLSHLKDIGILRYREKRGGQLKHVLKRTTDLVSIPLINDNETQGTITDTAISTTKCYHRLISPNHNNQACRARSLTRLARIQMDSSSVRQNINGGVPPS